MPEIEIDLIHKDALKRICSAFQGAYVNTRYGLAPRAISAVETLGLLVAYSPYKCPAGCH